MVTYNGLPLYRVALDSEQDGVLRVSLVDDPAVESDFEVFRKAEERKPAMYAVQDEDKHLVRGVILRADYPIYRRDKKGDAGYYVTFGADVIRQAAEKYLADDRANAVNLNHDGEEIDGVQMVQLFIKDSAAGVAPEGFDDIADGSLFGEYHVTNEDVWADIKAGTFKGFSVEIFYTLIPAGDAMHREEDEAEAVDMLLQIISHVTDMSKLQKIKARLANILAEFGSVTTDKGVIYWDGDEDLKAGDRVEVENAEGQREAAADGDYTTQDGKVIVVVEGAVSEIKDPAAEVAPAEESEGDGKGDGGADAEGMTAEKMARQKIEKFGASYTDKTREIADAIAAALGIGAEFYVADAGDDFAVAAVYGPSWEVKYQRFKVAWDGDKASVSDPVEVRYAAVPMDFDDAALFAAEKPETASVEEYEAAVKAAEDFKAENDTLKARIAELEKTPAGKSAKEQFKSDADAPEVDGKLAIADKGLARLARKVK